MGVEGTLGLFVRGANNGSNGLYFNDVPMNVSSHLMGMFSVYPADMVGEASFYMGALPAYRGNQSSSLLDVSIKRQYGSKFNWKFSISPYISSLYFSIPILKDRMSFQVVARTSFAPYLYNIVNTNEETMNIGIYDISAIIDYKLSKKHIFEAMFFTTSDSFEYTDRGMLSSQSWRSLIGKLGWRAVFNNKLNLNIYSYFSDTYLDQKDVRNEANIDSTRSKLVISSALKEWALNVKLHYSMSDRLLFDTGV